MNYFGKSSTSDVHRNFYVAAFFHVTVSSLLKCWPTFTHMQYGNKIKTMPVFKGPRLVSMVGEKIRNPIKVQTSPRSFHAIMHCFPAALDLFDSLGSCCTCTHCITDGKIDEGKSGCLRETGLAVLISLLAHIIADGFGACDVSGIVDQRPQKYLIQTLLSDLIWKRVIFWDTWFLVAACTYLGYPWSDEPEEYSEGATSIVAIQYGSLVVASTWIDLSQELSVYGCFGFASGEGQLQGVADERGILYAEATMKIEEPHASSRAGSYDAQTATAADPSSVQIQTAIIGAADGTVSRLLTMVRSNSSRRIVDPTDAMVSLCLSTVPTCKHEGVPTPVDCGTGNIWTFDELLSGWNPTEFEWPMRDQAIGDGNIMMTTPLDTVEKFNVAMALCLRCVIQTSQCCSDCARRELKFKFLGGAAKRIIRKEVHCKHQMPRRLGQQPQQEL